ncbi:CPSF A subunit region-domain-containing protein [Chytriomyces sp. MP71]|nr:CPSF A subunit region-domain-containing protein [Chytriomyces sp. MP71]
MLRAYECERGWVRAGGREGGGGKGVRVLERADGAPFLCSAEMFAWNSNQHQATAIDHAVPCSVTHPGASNVAVARGAMLQIYASASATTTATTSNTNIITNVTASSANPSAPRALKLVSEFKLNGVVASLAVVRLPARPTDSLLLAFADAKMSLVDYSTSSSSLVTVSIHYFERDEFKKELTAEKEPPAVRVDPQSRCAALTFYGDRMAILPFRQDVTGDSEDLSSKYPFHPSYVFKISEIDPKIKRIIDFGFLYDYIEPTLAILYERDHTWTGRLAARNDTRSLLVVSLNTTKKTFPRLYESPHLPYNCTALYPLPNPVGGILVQSANALIYVDQTSLPGVAAAFNAFYGREHALPAPPAAESQGYPAVRDNMLYHRANVSDYKSWGVSLEGASVALVNPDTFLVVCGGDGECLLVELVGHEDAGAGWGRRNGDVRRFRATRMGVRATLAAGIVRVPPVGAGAVLQAQTQQQRHGASSAAAMRGFLNEASGIAEVDLFLASRVSDSLMVRLREVLGGEFGDQNVGEAGGGVAGSGGGGSASVPAVRPRYGRRYEVDDDDDDDLYGDSMKEDKKPAAGAVAPSATAAETTNGTHDSSNPPRFTLAVVDVLPGLGPVRDMAVGEAKRDTTDEYTPDDNTLRREMEAVCCVGQGVYGALGILAKNIRPEIHTTVDQEAIKGFKEVWTVKCFDPNAGEAENQYHRYLIMSNENMTTVLQTGREINQVTDSGFFTAGCSVYVTSVLKGTAIMQVQPNGVLLLNYEGNLIQNMEIGDTDTWIVSCSVSDAYVVLLLCDGGLILLKSDEETRRMTKVHEKKDASISCASLYCNPAGIKSLQTVEAVLRQQGKSHTPFSQASTGTYGTDNQLSPASSKRKHSALMADDDDDDEDDDLYGSSSGDSKVPSNVPDSMAMDHNGDGETDESSRDEVYCFAYKEDGALEVLKLPDFTQVFHVPQFDNLGATIGDIFAPPASLDGVEHLERGADINEILVTALGPDPNDPVVYLMARTELGDLIIYKAVVQQDFSQTTQSNQTGMTPTTPVNQFGGLPPLHRLALVLVRVPHSHLSREPVVYADTDGDKLKPAPKPRPQASFVKRHYLRPFSNVGSAGNRGSLYSGVFMTGRKPCWIMSSQGGDVERAGFEVIDGMEVAKGVKIQEATRNKGKGFLRVHPSVVDGDIRTFAELHNMNTPNGFVYINDRGLLRLCTLPWKFNYDLEWPMCKIQLRRVPHKITYHFDSETYIMAASVPSNFNLSQAQQAAALASGAIEQGFELNVVEERAKEDRTGLYYPSSGAYSLELISPVDFQTVDRYALEVNEQVLCCQVVSLDSKQTTSGKKLFLVVGTGMCRGEDLTARGRILVFDIIDVVPEIDNPQSCHKFKLLHTVDEKSPITALCGLNGYLVCAIGSRMIIYTFEDSETLNGIAFLDTNIYVNNLSSIKNTLVLSDVVKGVWFVGFQEDPPKLKMLGKDYNPMQVYGCEYIVDDNMLAFVVSDQEKNLHMLAYQPEWSGPPGPKSILDGDLLFSFISLPVLQQREIAKGVGSTIERIVDDLIEVLTGTDYF